MAIVFAALGALRFLSPTEATTADDAGAFIVLEVFSLAAVSQRMGWTYPHALDRDYKLHGLQWQLRPRQIELLWSGCAALHIWQSTRIREAPQNISIPPPRQITSLSGARPDMEHTRLGLDAFGNPVSLQLHERLRQIAVLGKTGMGKSTLLRSIVAQDIARGDGLLLIDPHGTLAEECLELIPPHRRNHVCFFDLADAEYPIAFNILADVPAEDRELLAEGIVSAMHTIWNESWGPQLERILRNSLIVLLDSPSTSFLHIPRFLTDAAFRERVVQRARNPVARAFFENQFASWPAEFIETSISPVLNKVEAFAVNQKIRNVLGQERSKLHFEHALKHGRIVIAKLAKGSVGDKPAFLMGSLLLARAQAAIMARGRDASDRRPFHIVIDEAQNFGAGVISTLLTDARKFAGSVTVATQFLDRLDADARQAVLGSTETLVCFRLGPDDAQHLSPLFDREHQHFNPHVLYNLELGEAWCRSSFLYPDLEPQTYPNVHNTRQQSRRHYGRPRHVVEREVDRIFRRKNV
jgi:hypothetical protein